MKVEICPRCKSELERVIHLYLQQEADERPDVHYAVRIEAMLDNIRSAWNVGSMFRTADGTSFGRVYLCGITPTPDHPQVSRTALGAEKMIPWDYCSNAVDQAQTLLDRGYRLWALEDMPGAINLFDIVIEDVSRPIVLVVGNEVCGIDPGVMSIAEQIISIPMMGKKRSYNVAVAFGIAASYLRYCQTISQGSVNKFPNT